MKTAILVLFIVSLVLVGACTSTNNGGETQSAVTDSTTGAEIIVEPALGSYIGNSLIILKDIQIKTDISDKKYFSPWYPSLEKGDPCLIVSGHIQNRHKGKSNIVMSAEGYDEAGEEVAWTLDAAPHHRIQLGLEYGETGAFTLHLNVSEDMRTILIFAGAYEFPPP